MNFVITALVAGLLGVAALEIVMWLITRAGWAEGNMIVAVGSILTKSRSTAWRAGALLHAVSGVVFAMIYTFAMMNLGLAHMPTSLLAGIGFGIIHGIIVSLMLVWIVAEQHPLQEFQEAGLAVGVSHLAGHVAYGAVVGLVIGLMLH